MRLKPVLATLAIIALAVTTAGAGAAADPRKVIRDVFPVAETGFDPAAVHDLYSAGIVRAIFETLYTYDYLARPAKIVPAARRRHARGHRGREGPYGQAAKGIYFQSDPAFGGKKRELTADDVVYSYKRARRSQDPLAVLVPGRRQDRRPRRQTEAAKKSGKFDYDKKIPGLEAVDRYTVRFRMNDTDYNLPYVMAHESLADRRARGRSRSTANPTVA